MGFFICCGIPFVRIAENYADRRPPKGVVCTTMYMEMFLKEHSATRVIPLTSTPA